MVLPAFILFHVLSEFGGGRHGSIKRYEYSIPKDSLQKVINNVLKSSSIIKIDSVKNYYNDGLGYCPMTIFKNKEYKYIFRYYGDSALWAKAKSSEIFICYAYEDNKGGSEGNNSFRWKWGLKDRVVKAFENEFINKVDSALGY